MSLQPSTSQSVMVQKNRVQVIPGFSMTTRRTFMSWILITVVSRQGLGSATRTSTLTITMGTRTRVTLTTIINIKVTHEIKDILLVTYLKNLVFGHLLHHLQRQKGDLNQKVTEILRIDTKRCNSQLPTSVHSH